MLVFFIFSPGFHIYILKANKLILGETLVSVVNMQ